MLKKIFQYLNQIKLAKEGLKALLGSSNDKLEDYAQEILESGDTDIFTKAKDNKSSVLVIPSNYGKNYGNNSYSFSINSSVYGGYDMEYIIWPSNITTIPSIIFAGASELKGFNSINGIHIPEGIIKVSDWAFSRVPTNYNYADVKELILPSTLQYIEQYAFQWRGTFNADFSKCCKVEYIKQYAFQACGFYGKKVDLSNLINCKSMDLSCFNQGSTPNEYKTEEMILPPNLEDIGMYVIDGSNVKYIKIPDSVITMRGMLTTNSLIVDFGNTRTTIPTATTIDICSAKNTLIIPDALYNDWSEATNWNKWKSHMIKYSDYYVDKV